ncbi:flagellin [Oceanimonas sp. CAM02]|uniref:flagellin N-terminal helical domain-containing protein n=1 Tax=Oceanimonas sp. CAM02 TaxID=3080336 RepID=UPI00293633A1|nr:flagellin [Oceanimonas sp. CAM02]MDV2856433.1 flagellin [Oceanimonas sp. CAM02]
MAITVNTNVTGMVAQRNLTKSSNHLATSMERLATGSRINSAKDDAAGLQISNRLNSQARGLGVAMKNAQDGNSIIQTAEGALGETTEILQRMRDLVVQGANDTNSDADREAIQEELKELVAEIDNIACTTKFGGQKVLNGDFSSKTLQIGADMGETLEIKISKADASSLSVSAGDLTNIIGTAATGSYADFCAAISKLDSAIKTVDGERAKMGATQNRLESTINNLANTRENVTAGMSRIKDVDFAQETVNLTKQQILQQAGTSILAQAKQIPQAALSLLG